MAFEDDELLAEQSILKQELGLGACQIKSDAEGHGAPRQSGPAEVERFEPGEELDDEGIEHGRPLLEKLSNAIKLFYSPAFRRQVPGWTFRPPQGIPSFREAVKGAKGLARLYEHHAARQMLLAQTSESEPSRHRGAGFDIAAANIFQSLHAAGIPAPRSMIVTDEEEAAQAAKEIGYPVVLKAAARSILHRNELGGVVLQIPGERELRSAFVGLVAKTTALGVENRFFVQEYIANGIEMILGGLRDPAFGPVVMVGSGGVWVEILQDAVFRAAPVGRQMAQAIVDELKGRSLLDGYRGKPHADRAALVEAIVTFSELFAGLSSEKCSEIEINPLVVLPEGKGVCALDIKVQDQEGSIRASAS